MRFLRVLAVVVSAMLVQPAMADDWPQWLGPKRDSVWRESGIVKKLKDAKVKWRKPVGLGFSGPAVANGRVFVTDYVKRTGEITNNPGRRDKLQGVERVLCFDAKTGKLLWNHTYPKTYEISYPSGPRCTPTVDGDRVYTLGAEGDLLCLNAGNGKLIWTKSFNKDYGAETPIWGHSAHPLVHGDTLYCVVGGKGSIAVAFDKKTGREKWRALSARSQGYCPPVVIETNGEKQLVIWNPETLNGLDLKTGKVLWSVEMVPSFGMSISAPRQTGSKLFTTGYRSTAALVDLKGDKASVLWRAKPREAMFCANSTPFIDGDTIYGVDGNSGGLVAARLKDGRRLWDTTEPVTKKRGSRHGTAFLVKHEDRFFLFNETGDLILAKLTPKGYTELGRLRVVDPTQTVFGREVVWSHPAFAEKCVFARNDKQLVCVDLASE